MSRQAVDLYFDWLLGFIKPESGYRTYNLVLHKLFEEDFVVIVERDKNRVADALALREQFAEDFGAEIIRYYGSIGRRNVCNILEVLVAMAWRCENYILYDPEITGTAQRLFWVMLGTMGLDKYDDRNYDEDAVRRILKKFLSREYNRNGQGSIFMTNNKEIDMRKTELWYQAQYYISEHYDGF